MRPLNLITKAGFYIRDAYKPINIRDSKGRLFYSTEATLPRIREFNLPGSKNTKPGIELGNYFVESGNFFMMDKPVNYPLIPMPQPERYLSSPFDFAIKFEPNPSKCTISWKDKAIIFDVAFLEFELPKLYYTLYHEYGHQFFGTNKKLDTPEYLYSEKMADRLASNYMLVKGFNPEQIGDAHVRTLGQSQWERKKDNVENLKKYVNVNIKG